MGECWRVVEFVQFTKGLPVFLGRGLRMMWMSGDMINRMMQPTLYSAFAMTLERSIVVKLYAEL